MKWNTDYNRQTVEGKGRSMVILAFVICQMDWDSVMYLSVKSTALENFM